MHMVGLITVPFLARATDLRLGDHARGYPRSFLIGVAFGAGWTPCIGPVLASILLYVSATATVGTGTALLLLYSLGLGLPFVLAALGVSASSGWTWLKRHSQALNTISGVTLVAMGGLFVTGRFFYLSIITQRAWYALTTLGKP